VLAVLSQRSPHFAPRLIEKVHPFHTFLADYPVVPIVSMCQEDSADKQIALDLAELICPLNRTELPNWSRFIVLASFILYNQLTAQKQDVVQRRQ
jgi:hypothetical protein